MVEIIGIIDLIKNEQYDVAESMLLELWRKNSQDPYINYLLGYLYDQNRNPSQSVEKAKRHFRISITSDKPIEKAFIYLSLLERNQEHARRILARGLTFFPKSQDIYERLLTYSPNNEKASLFNEMVRIGVDSDDAKKEMMHHYFRTGDFTLALDLAEKAQAIDEITGLVFRLFKGLCFLEKGKLEQALKEFQWLISQDVTNALDYAPTFFSIVAHSRKCPAGKEDALILFAQVPDDFQFIEPYIPGKVYLWIDYLPYILESIKFLIRSTRKKHIIARARGIRAHCVIGCEAYSQFSKTKAYEDLVFAHSVLPSISKYAESLLELAEEKGDAFSTYCFSMDFISSLYGKDLEEKATSLSWAFIDDCTKDVFQKIMEDLERRLKEDELYAYIAKYAFPAIVRRLHKEKNYLAVQSLVNLLGDNNIKDTNVFFVVAYALREVKDNKRAAKFYELLLKDDGRNTGALNNLALIREELGDLLQAEQLLSTAKALDPDDPIIKTNLDRIVSLRKTAIGFMTMSYENKRALLRLWEARDIEDQIMIDLDKLPTLLGLPDDEASDILRLLKKEKIILPCFMEDRNKKNKKFILNPAVRCNISLIEKEIEEKAPIIEIANDIAKDGLARIGFNEELMDALEKVFSIELRNFLRRDLREAAFALLTRSYKTTQVMCGSIIEAVLLDKLSKRGIKKYLCEDKKTRHINKMNLDQLLHASFQENLINEQLYHFAHALRGFRNLIHPGIEQRGQAMPISESNAKLAWDITRKLLKEI